MNAVWISLLNSAVRYYLSQDPETIQRLSRLEGKVVHIILSVPYSQNLKGEGYKGQSLYLRPSQEGLRFSTECNVTPDVVIQGSPYALWQAQKTQTLAGKLQVTGDLECAQQLAQIMRSFDGDWEEWLSRWIGDPMACCVYDLIGKTRHWLKRTTASVRHTMTDYLQEEIRATPSASELEQFYRDIYELKNTLERLEARYPHIGST